VQISPKCCRLERCFAGGTGNGGTFSLAGWLWGGGHWLFKPGGPGFVKARL